MAMSVLALAALVAAGRAQEPAKPGPEHDYLKTMVGEWEATVKFGGGETKAKASYKLDFGGFFLVEEFEGDFGGMKFKGRGQTGYCPLRKKYVSTWIDSMSPTPMTMIGSYDKEKKSMVMEGEGPGMDGKMTKIRSKSVTKSDDEFGFTMYTLQDGKETEMMSITYKRKK